MRLSTYFVDAEGEPRVAVAMLDDTDNANIEEIRKQCEDMTEIDSYTRELTAIMVKT